jgi:sugar phosphate isomerase/epimerase
MRLIVLTKPLGPLDPAGLADALAHLRADGTELLVRAGSTVDPANPAGICAVARELRRNGLRLDLVTTDLLAADTQAERILAACSAAEVGAVRVGFYRYDSAVGYHEGVDRARRLLAGLVELAQRESVPLALQLHHGTLHSSAALALRLTKGMPEIRFYADPGNQVKEGSEDWRLMLDLLGDRIACVGVKTATWSGSGFEWRPLADGGVVPWPEILPGLRSRGYTGPLSLHVHYPVTDPMAALRRDLDRLRELTS